MTLINHPTGGILEEKNPGLIPTFHTEHQQAFPNLGPSGLVDHDQHVPGADARLRARSSKMRGARARALISFQVDMGMAQN